MGIYYKGEEVGFIVNSPTTGTLEITENGEYDVRDKAKVDVKVGEIEYLNIALPEEFENAKKIYHIKLNNDISCFSCDIADSGLWVYNKTNLTMEKKYPSSAYFTSFKQITETKYLLWSTQIYNGLFLYDLIEDSVVNIYSEGKEWTY